MSAVAFLVPAHAGPILARDEIADPLLAPGITLLHRHLGFFGDDKIEGGIERHFERMTNGISDKVVAMALAMHG
jgi:hypothetical protein